MPRIRIKYSDNITRDEDYVLNSVRSAIPDINITNIYHGREYSTLTISSDEGVNELFAQPVVDKLAEFKLKPTPPPNYLPSRTVFIHKINYYISNKSEDEILKSINDFNSNIARKVFIIKAKNFSEGDFKSLKVIFHTPASADKAASEGLFVCGLNLSKDQITKEIYTSVPQCFKCFKFDHVVKNCSATVAICSFCSVSGHNYKSCIATSPKCALCKGNHNAVSPLCPKRKEQIKIIQATNNARTNASLNHQLINGPISNQPVTSPPLFDQNAFPSLRNKQTRPSSVPQVNNPLLQQQQQHGNLNNNKASLNPPMADFEVRLSVYKSMAEKLASDNNDLFIALMNDFLIQHGFSPIDTGRMNRIKNNLLDPDNNPHPDASISTQITPAQANNDSIPTDRNSVTDIVEDNDNANDADMPISLPSHPPSPMPVIPLHLRPQPEPFTTITTRDPTLHLTLSESATGTQQRSQEFIIHTAPLPINSTTFNSTPVFMNSLPLANYNRQTSFAGVLSDTNEIFLPQCTPQARNEEARAYNLRSHSSSNHSAS